MMALITDEMADTYAVAGTLDDARGKLERFEGIVDTVIVNPPWTLAGELKTILPELEKPLGQGGAGRFRLETPKP